MLGPVTNILFIIKNNDLIAAIGFKGNLLYYYFFLLIMCRISAELELPSLPEMVFGDNILQIDHTVGFGIQFNAIDALKRVDNRHDLMKVAVAEEWQSKR